MKDNEKCTKCKLRFRCFTEIKVDKKKKTKTKTTNVYKPGEVYDKMWKDIIGVAQSVENDNIKFK